MLSILHLKYQEAAADSYQDGMVEYTSKSLLNIMQLMIQVAVLFLAGGHATLY